MQQVTMADVAARAGVSRALVSIVMRGVPGASPQNRERVLRAAAELDYHPDQRARLLGSGRSHTLGVVHGLHEPFHGDLLEELYAAVVGTPWRLTLEPRGRTRSEADAVTSLLHHRVEAVVLLGPHASRTELAALAARLPVISLARAVRGADVGVVRTDDEAAARLAVEHLVDTGHRRIVHLHGGRAAGAAERRAGYRKAMTAVGLPVELMTGSAQDVAHELLTDLPDAVLAFNDEAAAELLHALRARGVTVPSQVSVMGFDDSSVAALPTVSLTTVGQDAASLARIAVEQAVARIEDDGVRDEVVVPPRLVVRGSVGGACGGGGPGGVSPSPKDS